MSLALISVDWLLFFIHHISHAISVNHIVDRIAREAEEVIDVLRPYARVDPYRPPVSAPLSDEQGLPILNEVSGYIRFIDTKRLLAFTRLHHLSVRVTRRVGAFVPAGGRRPYNLRPQADCGGPSPISHAACRGTLTSAHRTWFGRSITRPRKR